MEKEDEKKGKKRIKILKERLKREKKKIKTIFKFLTKVSGVKGE